MVSNRLLPFLAMLVAAPVAAQTEGAAESAEQEAPARPTPMAERELVLGLLDKASGETSEVVLRPGMSYRFEELTIHARACEKTPPWEPSFTGAFLRIEAPRRSGLMETLFSGWLYAEFPSLNSFDNPDYDVWMRDCRMSFPEIGPDTTVVR